MRQCLDGAGAALDAEQHHDDAATIAALHLVDAACRAAQGTEHGPAVQYGFDFPDPFVLTVGPEHYAFATNASAGTIQMLRRGADGAWDTAGNALSALPAWAVPGSTWSPAVLARPSGFVMYYAAREKLGGRECISVARAPSPLGPFVDATAGPLECGVTGAIDPEPVVAVDGTTVLLWKQEPGTIMARRLAGDGLSLSGDAVTLLHPTQSWERGNVEAPSMLVGPGGVWLFYSANDWNTRNYAEGVVHCASVLGPCDHGAPGPVLRAHDSVMGPGGGSVFQDAPGEYRLAYHAYQAPNVGYPASRLFYVATIDLASGRPVIVE